MILQDSIIAVEMLDFNFWTVSFVDKNLRVSGAKLLEKQQWRICVILHRWPCSVLQPRWTRRQKYMRRTQSDTLEGTWLHPVFKWPAAHPPCLKLITWLKTTFVPDHGWRHTVLRSSSEGLREDCVQIASHLGKAVKGNENVMLASCTERIVRVDEVKSDEVLQVSKAFFLSPMRDQFCGPPSTGTIQIRFMAADFRSVLQPSSVSLD